MVAYSLGTQRTLVAEQSPVGGEMEVKAAVTVVLADIVSVQVVAVPEQAPDQPAKVEPREGVAVRVILVSEVTVSVQSVPQKMPVPVTMPEPVPLLKTVRV